MKNWLTILLISIFLLAALGCAYFGEGLLFLLCMFLAAGSCVAGIILSEIKRKS
jgi:hypothetical protein